MGKKKNQEHIQIVDRELYPTVIGEIDDTEKKPIFLYVMIIILGVLLFGLPYITDFFTNLKGDTVTPIVNKNNNEEEKEESTSKETNDDNYYLIASSTTVKYDSVEISEISFVTLSNVNYIRLSIKNTGAQSFRLSDQNYYLELYNNDKKLLQRIKMTGDTIEVNSKIQVLSAVKNKDEASQFKFVKKSQEDYPEHEISKKGSGSLTCKKDTETYIYKFNKDKLLSITEIYQANSIANVASYRTKTSTYNAVTGITATLDEQSNGFKFNAEIDLSKAKVSSLKNDHLYENNTSANVVYFEMDAMGYTCS